MKLNRKGQAGGIALVLGVVVVVVALFIGLFMYAEISDAIPRGSFSAAQNTTFTNIQSNTESGFNLAAIIPIVLVAFAIIGILTGAGLRRR
jgi:hypothetical protein